MTGTVSFEDAKKMKRRQCKICVEGYRDLDAEIIDKISIVSTVKRMLRLQFAIAGKVSLFVKTDLTGFVFSKNLGLGCYHRRSHSLSPSAHGVNDNNLSIHISPCGDWWLGAEIYAAKHLPSGYVRSIKLPDNFDEDNHLLDELPASAFLQMYDSGVLNLIVTSVANEKNNDGKPTRL